MKAVCSECQHYNRQEQMGDYTFQCSECGAENDKNDLYHSEIGKFEWCGKHSCPRCQGYSHPPK